jgi:hypothetical protein
MARVRVLRVIEYIGERERVEKVVEKSIHGTRFVDADLTIRAATVGDYPESFTYAEEEQMAPKKAAYGA